MYFIKDKVLVLCTALSEHNTCFFTKQQQRLSREENDVSDIKSDLIAFRNSTKIQVEAILETQAIKVIVPSWVQTHLYRSQSAFMKPPSDWIIRVTHSRRIAIAFWCYLSLFQADWGELCVLTCGVCAGIAERQTGDTLRLQTWNLHGSFCLTGVYNLLLTVNGCYTKK